MSAGTGPTPSEDEQHYNDKRSWPRYDELLVLRGEMYLSTDSMRSWDGELGMMNGGRRGRPYDFPAKKSCAASDEPERIRARPQPPSLPLELILGTLSPAFGGS